MSYCKRVTCLLEMHPTYTTTMSQHGVQSALKEFEEAGLSTGLNLSTASESHVLNNKKQTNKNDK